MNAIQISAVTEALNLWSDLTNIDFKRVGTGAGGPDAYSNSATMLFGNYKSDADAARAFSVPPNKNGKPVARPEGDVWVNIYKDAHIATDADLRARQTINEAGFVD